MSPSLDFANLEAPRPELVACGLRAVKTVITARAPMHETQRAMIALAQRLLLRTSVDLDALEPITPAEVCAQIPLPAGRERVVRGILLATLARGEVSVDDARDVESWASALGVDNPSIRNLRRVAEGHLAMLRYDVNRRAFTGQAIAELAETEGIFALLKGAASRAGLIEDHATVARFAALEHAVPGTLGRALWDYYQGHGFPIPGQKHALPAFGVVHDLCHVLSGYGVDGPGEIEVVCFQSGFMKRDPLSTIFFIVLQAHLGVRLVAIAPGKAHALDDPKLLERAMRALRRGAQVNRDLFDHWDYGPELGRPIEEVRASLGVPAPDPTEA
jgi:hypothetical protein